MIKGFQKTRKKRLYEEIDFLNPYQRSPKESLAGIDKDCEFKPEVIEQFLENKINRFKTSMKKFVGHPMFKIYEVPFPKIE